MKEEDKVGVALAKEACPVCAKSFDGPILMNTRLSGKNAKDVEALHGQIIGFRDAPCDECKELLTKGFVLIGIEQDKTEDMSNPYRSGHMWCISKESAEGMFPDAHLRRLGYACIDVNVAESIGLPIFET
jgi:hypothetical protein